MKPRSNCMPSTTSRLVSRLLDSSTVMTPSLPTFSMASAIRLPISVSLLAEMAATWEISSFSLMSLALFLMSSTAISTALRDAALDVHGVDARGHRLQAFLDHRVGEDGRGGGAVAGHVVGLGGDFLQQLGAHVLERVLELDLLGDGDAVVGDRGGAELLVQDHVAALRAEGHLDGRGHLLHAAEELLACVLVETELFGHVSPLSSR